MISSTPTHLLPAMARTQLRKSVPTHTRISAIRQQPQLQRRLVLQNEKRQYSISGMLSYPRKDTQDRESMNTEATEYSKSATDDEAARRENAAFNPKLTKPETQKDKAGEVSRDQTNPLEVSPANPEVSKQRSSTEGGAQSSSSSSGDTSDRQRSSGGGSSPKGKKVA